MMTNRERLHCVFNREKPDRLPMIEWACWWDLTIERWRSDGIDPALGWDDFAPYYGLDEHRQYLVRALGLEAPEPEFEGAGIITNEEDYERVKPFLYPEYGVKRFADGINALKPRYLKGEMPIWMSLEGFFWFPRVLFGIENHLFSFYDYPDLIHRINEDLLNYNIKMIHEFCDVLKPDFMTLLEDMSYNHGPMLSKELFDEFLRPYYLRLTKELRQCGITSIVDSDGNVESMIPWLEDVGIDGILPLERQAGTEVASIRKNHPNFLMLGGFDKTIMKNGEDAIRAEFERLLPTMRSGGYIPSVDHQTPPDVSVENYKIYARLMREYCEKAVTA